MRRCSRMSGCAWRLLWQKCGTENCIRIRPTSRIAWIVNTAGCADCMEIRETCGSPKNDSIIMPFETNTVVWASAGTGKTRRLVEVYLDLLDRGVDPLRIVAVTFTERAAAE